jgi:hypothetical protein
MASRAQQGKEHAMTSAARSTEHETIQRRALHGEAVAA